MRSIDRLDLVERIGSELQARMTYGDIDQYLGGLGVDIKKPTSGVNSKRVYAKELLAGESDSLVVSIADELEIPHDYIVTAARDTMAATFWEPGHFRLFLSHLASFKRNTTALQASLRGFGISSFVAHVDIKPTKEWQEEIEAGLWSMDALAAILMPGFKESDWTDQEIGIAVGRGVLVVPVMRGMDPYGFVGKYQGLYALDKSVNQVASELFQILVESSMTRSRMLTCLVDTTLQSTSIMDVRRKLGLLNSLSDLPKSYLERLRDGARASAVFAQAGALEALNSLLVRRGLRAFSDKSGEELEDYGDIPF